MKKNRNWKRVFEGKKESPFFQSGYPTQPPLFREQITKTEWNRLDAEFEVWNHCKASNTSVFCKALYFFPGVYLLLIPTYFGFRVAEKREKAIQELVAKVNKLIFMKKRSIIEKPLGSWVEMAWYEIALTPDTIKRLEAQDTFDTDGVFLFHWRDPKNYYVNEHTVEEDANFETRWKR